MKGSWSLLVRRRTPLPWCRLQRERTGNSSKGANNNILIKHGEPAHVYLATPTPPHPLSPPPLEIRVGLALQTITLVPVLIPQAKMLAVRLDPLALLVDHLLRPLGTRHHTDAAHVLDLGLPHDIVPQLL